MSGTYNLTRYNTNVNIQAGIPDLDDHGAIQYELLHMEEQLANLDYNIEAGQYTSFSFVSLFHCIHFVLDLLLIQPLSNFLTEHSSYDDQCNNFIHKL